MCADDPVAVVFTTAVSPVDAEDVNVSPSVKVAPSFDEPLSLYFTNKVSGSVPSVASTFTILPLTPDVPPVTIVPTKFASVPVKDVNLTAS